MEWLSAMFKGIGDTFTAGANVNIAQISERNNKREISLGQESLATQYEISKLNFITDQKNQQNRTTLIVLVFLFLLTGILIYKRKS